MRIAALDENEVLHHVARWCRARPSAFVRIGIGDDAAVVRPGPGRSLAVTTDTLVEGVHFSRKLLDFCDVGARAAAQNLSDLAAMGARPRGLLVSLALPPETALGSLRAFYRGLAEVSKIFRSPVLGGNLSRAEGGWTVTIAALGEIAGEPFVRSGARPGDAIWVTGTLGDAAAWLAAALADGRAPRGPTPLRSRFARPVPRVREALALRRRRWPTAAMDLSDGLSTDLARLCAASGVGAEVELDTLPISAALARWSRYRDDERRRFALDGGEDFELLFTAAPEAIDPRRRRAFERATGTPLTRIGTITKARRLWTVDAAGKRRPLSPGGWDHFRKKKRDA